METESSRLVALAEAKGSFARPFSAMPDFRARLRGGLKQIECWQQYITPTPYKCFAIATYFREMTDCTESLMTVVDPTAESSSDDVPLFPPDWIRRGNYGAWLIGMGLRTAGEALRNGDRREDRRVEVLPTLQVCGETFAYAITGICIDRDRASPELLSRAHNYFCWWNDRYYESRGRYELLQEMNRLGCHPILSGLLVRSMRLIEKAVGESVAVSDDRGTLLQMEPFSIDQGRNSIANEDEIGFQGSVLPDGSLYGSVSAERLARIQTFEKFRL